MSTLIDSSQKEIEILNQLIAVQSMLSVFNDYSKMGEFIVSAIKNIPGVSHCSIIIRGIDQVGDKIDVTSNFEEIFKHIPEDTAKIVLDLPKGTEYLNYILQTQKRLYGLITIQFSNLDLFSKYNPAIRNFLSIITLNLENLWQKKELAKYQLILEKQVAEKTSELNYEIFEHNKSNVALLKSQSILTETEKIGKVGAWELNIDTGKQHWTEGIYHIHEVELDFEPNLDNGVGFYTNESYPLITSAVKKAINDGESFDLELDIISAKGNHKYVHAIGKPDLTNRRLYGFFQDITEKVLTEKALNEGIERFKNTFDKSPVSSAILGLDRIIKSCNKSFIDSLGYSFEEVFGKLIDDFTYIDDIQIGIDNLNELIKGNVETLKFCKRYIKKNNDIIWGEVTVSVVRDDNGNPLYLLPIILDITDRKISESLNEFRIKLNEDSYELSINEVLQITLDFAETLTQSKIGFFHFVDDDQENLTLVRWSTNTLKNMCTAEGAGSHYPIAKAGVWVDAFYAKEAVIHNKYSTMPNKKGMPEGHAEVTREVIVPFIRSGKVKALIGLGNKLTDYTDKDVKTIEILISFAMNIVIRKETEDELIQREIKLKELNSTKDKFFSIIAHDLKSPLGNFMQVTEYLFETYNDISDSERLKFLELMKVNAKSIYNLIENLLVWARSQRGNIKFEPEYFDLKFLIDNTINLLMLSANKKNIKIRINPESNRSIYADPNLLTIVVRNLVSNAIKFTRENGIIEIGVDINKSSQDEVYIYIKDSGIGMNEDTISKLFRIDQSITNLGTNGETGTGLGLILCKEFVAKHSGIIEVVSQINSGSTFYFSLSQLKNNIED